MRNAEIDIKKIKAELGEEGETITIHLHDFNPDAPRYPGGLNAEDSPHKSVTKDGTIIKLILNPYPPEDEVKKTMRE